MDALIQSGVISSLAHHFAVVYRASEGLGQALNAVAMVTNIAGCLLVGVLLDRGVKAVAIGFSGVILSMLSGLALFSGLLSFPQAVAASWIFTFGSGLWSGSGRWRSSVAPDRRSMGATSGLITQMTLLGVSLGAPTVFFLDAQAGAAPMLGLIVVVFGLCLVALPVWTKFEKSEVAAH